MNYSCLNVYFGILCTELLDTNNFYTTRFKLLTNNCRLIINIYFRTKNSILNKNYTNI